MKQSIQEARKKTRGYVCAKKVQGRKYQGKGQKLMENNRSDQQNQK